MEHEPIEAERIITLRVPVTIGDRTYDHLELREPTASELEKSEGKNTALIASIAKVPRLVAEKLCARDYKEAIDFLLSFMGGAQ